MIYHLLYLSEKSSVFNEETDLEAILLKSQTNNKKKDLTGLLIRNGNFFIQLLEGKKEAVTGLYNVIITDPRHTKARSLMSYQDNVRIFPSWSMGLAEGSDHQVSINELVPLLHADILKLQTTKEKVISILKSFNKI